MTETLTELSEEDAMTKAMAAFGLSSRPENNMEMVDAVEARMLELHEPVECRTGHVFTTGLYTRSIYLPAGTMLTSKIHKTEHQFMLLKGRISVWTEQGGEATLDAPHHGVTPPGTRRIGYAHTDVVWVTFHPTEETDLKKIEEEIIMPHVNPLLERSLS